VDLAALAAEAVAAFNPCGCALLPAYLGLLATDVRARAVAGAVRFAGA
jgi:cytochrome c biogenesis protein CcdA